MSITYMQMQAPNESASSRGKFTAIQQGLSGLLVGLALTFEDGEHFTFVPQ